MTIQTGTTEKHRNQTLTNTTRKGIPLKRAQQQGASGPGRPSARKYYTEKYYIRGCLFRYLFKKGYLKDTDHKNIMWYKKWYFLIKKDMGAPTLSTRSYTTDGPSFREHRGLTCQDTPYTPERFERDTANFYGQQRHLRAIHKKEVNLLELLLDKQHSNDQDNIGLFKTLSKQEKTELVDCLKKISHTLDSHPYERRP